MPKKFRVQFAGEVYFAEDWKGLRTLIKQAAYPLIMRAIEIHDVKHKVKKTFIVRRDGGRARFVKDGGRSVMATVRG